MCRIDQIDVVCALCDQFAKDVSQPFNRNRFAVIFVADAVVLAKAAAERATREKDGARAVHAADTGLLTEMLRRACYARQSGGMADALPVIVKALCFTLARAKGTEHIIPSRTPLSAKAPRAHLGNAVPLLLAKGAPTRRQAARPAYIPERAGRCR